MKPTLAGLKEEADKYNRLQLEYYGKLTEAASKHEEGDRLYKEATEVDYKKLIEFKKRFDAEAKKLGMDYDKVIAETREARKKQAQHPLVEPLASIPIPPVASFAARSVARKSFFDDEEAAPPGLIFPRAKLEDFMRQDPHKIHLLPNISTLINGDELVKRYGEREALRGPSRTFEYVMANWKELSDIDQNIAWCCGLKQIIYDAKFNTDWIMQTFGRVIPFDKLTYIAQTSDGKVIGVRKYDLVQAAKSLKTRPERVAAATVPRYAASTRA